MHCRKTKEKVRVKTEGDSGNEIRTQHAEEDTEMNWINIWSNNMHSKK